MTKVRVYVVDIDEYESAEANWVLIVSEWW